MNGVSSIECVKRHKVKICASIEVTPDIDVTDTFKTCDLKFKNLLNYLRCLQNFEDNR